MNVLGKMVPYLLNMMTKKTNTVLYPFVGAQVPDRFRGTLKFHGDKCVGCKICERVCPADALDIVKTGDKAYKAVLRLDECIFCGQCVDSCNKDALENTAVFELASSDKASLTVEI